MNSPNSSQVTPATITINSRFIPTIKGNDASEYECISCQEIPCDNMLYELGCGHGKLCGNCHDVVCTRRRTCPDQTTRECDESVREKLGKLQVVCQYSVPEQGHDACTWSGHLSEWKDHVLQCNYGLMKNAKCEAHTEEKPVEEAKLKEEIEQLKDKLARQEERINWLTDKLTQVMEILDFSYSKSDGSVMSAHPSDSRSVRSSVDMSGTPGLLPSIPPAPPSVIALSDTPSVSDDSYKTLLCMHWFVKVPCPYGDEDDCPFIHGEPELLNKQSYEEEWDYPKRKSLSTKVANEKEICPYFLKGECRYGDRCWNSHEEVGKNEMEPTDDEKMPKLVEIADKSPVPKLLSGYDDGYREKKGQIDAIRTAILPCGCGPGCSEMSSTLVPLDMPTPQM